MSQNNPALVKDGADYVKVSFLSIIVAQAEDALAEGDAVCSVTCQQAMLSGSSCAL